MESVNVEDSHSYLDAFRQFRYLIIFKKPPSFFVSDFVSKLRAIYGLKSNFGQMHLEEEVFLFILQEFKNFESAVRKEFPEAEFSHEGSALIVKI